jgi:hypothetical protein
VPGNGFRGIQYFYYRVFQMYLYYILVIIYFRVLDRPTIDPDKCLSYWT